MLLFQRRRCGRTAVQPEKGGEGARPIPRQGSGTDDASPPRWPHEGRPTSRTVARRWLGHRSADVRASGTGPDECGRRRPFVGTCRDSVERGLATEPVGFHAIGSCVVIRNSRGCSTSRCATRTFISLSRIQGTFGTFGRWVGLENLGRQITRNTFRSFVHPVSAMEQVIHRSGFTRLSHSCTRTWCAGVYAR